MPVLRDMEEAEEAQACVSPTRTTERPGRLFPVARQRGRRMTTWPTASLALTSIPGEPEDQRGEVEPPEGMWKSRRLTC